MGNHSAKPDTGEENQQVVNVAEKQRSVNVEEEEIQEIPPTDRHPITPTPQPPVNLDQVPETLQTGGIHSIGSVMRRLPELEQLSHCYGMALAGGHLYLSSSEDRVVDVVDTTTGARVTRYGTFYHPGQAVVGQPPLFDHPWGVAVDETRGRVYVADYNHHCVVVVRQGDGLVEAIWGSQGSGQQRFNNPCGLAYCPNTDLLYVADANNHCVKVLRGLDGHCVRILGRGQGNGNNQMYAPQGVAVDDTHIYITDNNNHRVVVYAKENGAFLFQMGQGPGSGNTQFQHPSNVSVDSEAGVVYVADFNNYRVCVYRGSDGSYVRHFQMFQENNFTFRPIGVMWDTAAGVLYVTAYSSELCLYPR